ncbi:polysaccharide export protein [Ensifer adhaerens]|uniref:polysaccharide biosynthesis/export family protein n=1 Tax=Ensifer adhaerens TaxID=106592 RepID=UPI001CC16239|nr:polysaccharide biosynthesis/export family protein [Ensifer adhaerens]MBZ7925729.1 polysaccharide export protein [Ensifer adhaerens]UAX95134.1 polysaccharide export protein [Ensifer adhaerens]UAY02975.1 polysaccharide export protein [Ensifer adhaerens]UAY10959.1 polysaccharide export protein [Ensifer adhaerens]
MKRIGVLFLVSALASCQSAVPGEGPLTGDILSDAGKSPQELRRESATVYEVVDVDSRSAATISSYSKSTLSKRLGFGGRPARATIGIGDRLLISIFEAGTDGLFSTSKSKVSNLEVVVQPNGKGAIPYVGEVRLAGLTLEMARQGIGEALKGKAVEPDVIVTSLDTASRNVTVTGAVNIAAVVPLNLSGEQLTDVITKAGGVRGETYDTFVTVTRGNKSGTILMSTLINNPAENIWVRPGDEITLVNDPRQFTVLGAVKANSRQPFGSRDLSLIEAVGMNGGAKDFATDAEGFFVFRYEEAEIAASLLGRARYDAMLQKGMRPDRYGRVPLVYRFDMSRPDSLLAGQTFPVNNRDVIYVSRHLTTDIAKFLGIVGKPLRIANTGVVAAHRAMDMSN